MLVYQNETAQKAFYGDRKIYRAYLGDKLVFNYDFSWKNPYSNLLLYDGTVINYTDEGSKVMYEGVNDTIFYLSYSEGTAAYYLAKDTGLYENNSLLYDGKWSRLSYRDIFKHSAGSNAFIEYKEVVGIVDGEAAVYLSADYLPGGIDLTPLSKCNEQTKKVHGTHALTESGNLLYRSHVTTSQYGYNVITGAEWKIRDSSVVDLCENAYLKQDGGIYTLKSELVTTIDSTDVKSFEQGFIVDGFINKLSGSALTTSNTGGFTAASYNIAIKDGVLFDITDLNNVTAVPESPDNFVEVSLYVARTDDNRFFQWYNNQLTEIIWETAE